MLSWKCYILAFIAIFLFLIFKIDKINNIMNFYIPDKKYMYVAQGLIIFCVIFLTCSFLETFNI